MLDAYDLARLNGFSGTRLDFQKDEYAKGGFDAAKKAGYGGSEESLQKTLTGEVDKSAWSAYEIAKAYGFNGSAQDWLDSLRGLDGMDAYDLAVSKGYQGAPEEWLESLQGKDGLDAYQVWLSLGNVGEKDVYLDSLRGLPGQDGQDGEDGKDGLSAYQIAVQNGFGGSESEWLRSLQGQDGEDGAVGPMPRHEWSGTRLRFEKPDGTWGEWVELRGTGAGPSGGGGGSLSIQKFYASADDFPTPGKTQILYFDQSTDPYGVFVWTGTAYQQVGGGGSTAQETFESVSKNIASSDYELTYNGAGDLTVITYANGIIKTWGYLGSGDLGTITLSGSTPLGISLQKSLTYNEAGDLISVSYSSSVA